MLDCAVEQVGDRRQADVRVRTHVQLAPGRELAAPHLIEEDERPDHLTLGGRQGTPHLEAANVVGAV